MAEPTSFSEVTMKVKFGVIADLHTEFIHDAPNRLEVFLGECEREACDFCIELGDFCPPGEIHKWEKKEGIESEMLFRFTFFVFLRFWFFIL